MTTQLVEQKCVSDWRELNYVGGPKNGPPLVMLHGVTRRWQDFMPLIPSLALRWQVFALDFRGHGKSDRTPDEYLTVHYMHDARALLENTIKQPAIVYGHSLGAMVALAIAAEIPDLVRAVVLEDPPFETMGKRIERTPLLSYFAALQQLAGEKDSVAEYARALADLRYGPPGDEQSIRLADVRDAAEMRFSARCLMDLDPQVFEPIVSSRWLESYDLNVFLPHIKCPVLLMQADQSAGGMLAHEDAATLESRLPDLTKINFNGVGHSIHWMATSTTLRLVTAFLESLSE